MLVEYVPPSQRFDVLICAIHAGVEIGTADVAQEIHAACRDRCGLYIHWSKHHVTSSLFEDPLFDTVVRQYKTVISIHGMRSTEQIAHIGGRGREEIHTLRKALGLPLNKVPPRHLRGEHIENVVNRAGEKAGVQIEVSYPVLHADSPLRSWLAQTVAQTLLRS
jgi:phage replication-related protein YjqB (UPF0714/DUF867 family)